MVNAAPFRFNALTNTRDGADTTFIKTLPLAEVYCAVFVGVNATDSCCALPNGSTVPDGGV